MTPATTVTASSGQVSVTLIVSGPTTTVPGGGTPTGAPASAIPPTTGPGSVITITGGPNATAKIVGPHNDPADFWGSALVIVAILASITLARLVFRRPGRPEPPAEGPR